MTAEKINVKRWLTDRQLRLYDYNTRQGDHYKDVDIVQSLESLAATRASEARKQALLEKHQWVNGRCLECGKRKYGPIKHQLHKPGCKWAAELEGGE